MTVLYAFSDLEGHLDLLHAVLDLVDLPGNTEHALVALGDYVDRGPDSAGVLYALKDASNRYPDRVVALRGNHEVDWLEWLDGDDDDFDWLSADTALVTTRSFIGDETVARILNDLTGDATDPDVFAHLNAAVKREVKTRHRDLISWLWDRPLVWETDAHIWVHAGIEEDAGTDWRLMTSDLVLTHKFPATFGPFHKTIVAGHVSTETMHHDGGHGIYTDAGHIYLDGDVRKNGDLNVLRYDTTSGEYEHLTVH